MSASRVLDGQIYFTNLPALVGGGFQPAAGPGAGWFPFTYELDRFGGVGLATGAYSSAGELVLDLGLTGWHRLHVAHNPAIRLWLDGETGYCEMPGDPSTVRDHAFPAADFTGRRLYIAPVRGAEVNLELTLFYLRAEPLDGPPTHHRNLVATNDGHGVFYSGIDTPRDIYRHIYPFRDSDFFRMKWGVNGGFFSLRAGSRITEIPECADEGCYRGGDYVLSRSHRRLRIAGADPLAVVRQATREYGLEPKASPSRHLDLAEHSLLKYLICCTSLHA